MRVAVVGGGAAGLMAAAQISLFMPVTVLERGEKPGKKVYITGKGRCNLTNLVPPEEFLKNVVNGAKFLTGCINRFSPSDTVEYFENIGLALATERGNRVFPQSNKASDVTKSLVSVIEKNGGRIITDAFVTDIIRSIVTDPQNDIMCGTGKDKGKTQNGIESLYTLTTSAGNFEADTVILAAGGMSYAATGSDGNGYALCKKLGHTIINPIPALVPFVLDEDVSPLMGLSLKNIRATVRWADGAASEFGEMLFTQRGVSGPIILSLSSIVNRKTGLTLSIDLKPALDENTLDKRILNDFDKNINRSLKNALDELLPKSMIPFIIEYAGVDGEKKVNLITKEERSRLLDGLKNLCFRVKSLGGFDEAVVTSGGVTLAEVNPKTMESRLNKNLYIVGELLDIDAFTGGFNLQLAWSTAMAAAEHVRGTH